MLFSFSYVPLEISAKFEDIVYLLPLRRVVSSLRGSHLWMSGKVPYISHFIHPPYSTYKEIICMALCKRVVNRFSQWHHRYPKASMSDQLAVWVSHCLLGSLAYHSLRGDTSILRVYLSDIHRSDGYPFDARCYKIYSRPTRFTASLVCYRARWSR